MANLKNADEMWSTRYKQEVIDYVEYLESELKRLTNGSYGKARQQDGCYKSRTGNSKMQNVRTAYNMYYRDQCSKSQIARVLMVSESTVTRYLTLAREELNARNGAYSPQGKEMVTDKRKKGDRTGLKTGIGLG